MILLINGALGVGKTRTSETLLAKCDRGAMLDVDALSHMRPFNFYDGDHLDHVDDLIVAVAQRHVRAGYSDLIINWVWEDPARLSRLRERLWEVSPPVRAFRLTCDAATLAERVRARNTDRLEWELERSATLSRILDAASERADMGTPVDTTALSPAEAADTIWAEMRGPVRIAPYDAAWPKQFEAERQRLAAALGSEAIAIHHIGSTSVPGLAAKPIIDILVTVAALAHARACIPALRELGYVFIDWPDNTDRAFFAKGHPRTHHCHIVEAGSSAEEAPLLFRDRLRSDAGLREGYAAMKQELKRRFPNDAVTFSQHKSHFVHAALAKIGAARMLQTRPGDALDARAGKRG